MGTFSNDGIKYRVQRWKGLHTQTRKPTKTQTIEEYWSREGLGCDEVVYEDGERVIMDKGRRVSGEWVAWWNERLRRGIND